MCERLRERVRVSAQDSLQGDRPRPRLRPLVSASGGSLVAKKKKRGRAGAATEISAVCVCAASSGVLCGHAAVREVCVRAAWRGADSSYHNSH